MFKVFFLIIFFPYFQLCWSEDFVALSSPGFAQIRAGMDEIASGFPQKGIVLLRKGRADLFEHRKDPIVESLLKASLLEEARGEIMLGASSFGVRKGIHLEAAEKLLLEIENGSSSLESHTLFLDLLNLQGKGEMALKKVDLWLDGLESPFERGQLLLAKSRLLPMNEELKQEALAAFEEAHFEGEEVLKLRIALAKSAEERGDLTLALRTLSKVVNTRNPSPLSSPLIVEALNLRGDLLEKMGRSDLKERHKRCGN